jgi:hypothetical protein
MYVYWDKNASVFPKEAPPHRKSPECYNENFNDRPTVQDYMVSWDISIYNLQLSEMMRSYFNEFPHQIVDDLFRTVDYNILYVFLEGQRGRGDREWKQNIFYWFDSNRISI